MTMDRANFSDDDIKLFDTYKDKCQFRIINYGQKNNQEQLKQQATRLPQGQVIDSLQIEMNFVIDFGIGVKQQDSDSDQ